MRSKLSIMIMIFFLAWPISAKPQKFKLLEAENISDLTFISLDKYIPEASFQQYGGGLNQCYSVLDRLIKALIYTCEYGGHECEILESSCIPNGRGFRGHAKITRILNL